MTGKQVMEFNSLFEKGCNKMEGLIMLGNYKPTRISFFEKMRAKKAIKCFEKALSIHAEHFQSLFFIGKLYQRLQEYKQSLSYMEAVLEIEHENHSIPQEASLVAVNLGDIEKAIKYSKEALRRKPENIVLLGNHSMNLLIAGYDEEAKSSIDKAIAIDPTDETNQKIKNKIESVISGQIKRPTIKDIFG